MKTYKNDTFNFLWPISQYDSQRLMPGFPTGQDKLLDKIYTVSLK
jgi:hypothetical protein